MASSTSIEEAKAELRREARVRRDALPADMRAAAAQAIAARPFPISLTLKSIVSGFMPIGNEINPIPLMRNLAVLGAQLALPARAQGHHGLRACFRRTRNRERADDSARRAP